MRPLRLLPLLVVLAACGQTGPLVLPEPTQAPPAFDPVVVTPPEDASEDDRADVDDATDEVTSDAAVAPPVASPSKP